MTGAGDWVSPDGAWRPVPPADDSPYAWGVPPKRSRGTRIGLIVAGIVAVPVMLVVVGLIVLVATGDASAAGGCGGG